MRARQPAVPVLILTATDAVELRVRMFEAGSGDFIAKPFAPGEPEARVRALVQTESPGQPSTGFGVAPGTAGCRFSLLFQREGGVTCRCPLHNPLHFAPGELAQSVRATES